ncbi:unnamed protein product, partial [Protopolystoma xenopodis]
MAIQPLGDISVFALIGQFGWPITCAVSLSSHCSSARSGGEMVRIAISQSVRCVCVEGPRNSQTSSARHAGLGYLVCSVGRQLAVDSSVYIPALRERECKRARLEPRQAAETVSGRHRRLDAGLRDGGAPIGASTGPSLDRRSAHPSMAEADESAARHVELLTTAELITGLVCYPIACLVGLVTNALCLLVFLRPDMRGLSTNTYLAALALADLMKLANDFVYTPGVLVKMLEHSDAAFPRYYPYAYFFNQFLASVTAWLTVAVAMERFLLVLRPVDSRAYLTLRKARIECAAVFVGLFLLNLPGIFRYRPVVRAPTTGRGGGNSTRSGSIESLETSWFWRLDQFKQAYIIPQTVLRSILPICLMIVLNITIIVALRRRFNWRRRQKLVSADVFAVSSGLRPSPRPQPASAWRVLTRHAGLGPGPGSGCQTLSNGRLAAEEAGSAELAPERRETAVGDAKQRLPVRHRVTIMLVAVMSGFVLLASPDALLSLLGWGYYDAPETWIRAIREITDCLLVVNSDTNFFLYYSLNPKFRNALRDSLRRLAWPPR